MGDPLVVLYDRGSASPAEIAVGLGTLGPVVFAVPDTEHTRQMAPVLARLGRVLPLTGDDEADTSSLRATRPAALLTFSELQLPAATRLAQRLGLPFHSPSTTRLLTDKTAQRGRLRAHDVDHTRSRPITSLAQWPEVRDHVGLPAVVKPAQGAGSRHTHLLRDDDDARRVLPAVLAARPLGGVVVEEFLRGASTTPYGDYVSVESVCFPRGPQHLAVTGKFPLAPPFRERGRFWPSALPADLLADVTALTSKALQALEVGIGLTHTEIKLTDDGPRVIEVNGRLGGQINHLAGQACGADLVALAGELALGADSADPLPPFDGVHFHHSTLAPTRECTLIEAHGTAEVRRIEGVTGHRQYYRHGDRFPASVGTRYLDLTWGHVADHTDMITTVEAAVAELSYDFRFTDGTRRLSANTLRGQEDDDG